MLSGFGLLVGSSVRRPTERLRRSVEEMAQGDLYQPIPNQTFTNEIGTMARNGIKPIIFVLNNDEYAIEEVLNQTIGHAYDKLARWQYHLLPAALGCLDWFSVRVKSLGQLDAALQRAASGDSAAYIEIVLGAADAPRQLPEAIIDSLYQVNPPS